MKKDKCLQCKKPTFSTYMLLDELWKQITKPAERNGMLCLDCVSARLGRKVTEKDFNDEPINWIFGHRTDEPPQEALPIILMIYQELAEEILNSR